MMKQLMGYERADGSFGIRNHVIVVPSVACANGVVQAIARDVPEVVPLYHGIGCGRGGVDPKCHTTILQHICKNPNVAAALVVGLGCEGGFKRGTYTALRSVGLKIVESM